MTRSAKAGKSASPTGRKRATAAATPPAPAQSNHKLASAARDRADAKRNSQLDLVRRSVPAEVFRAVADYTYDWESWIDPEGRTLWVNPAVERKTGYTVVECLAMEDYPLPIVHGEDQETIREVLKGALQGGSGNDFEFRIIRKDGEVRWMAISWQSIQGADGRPLGYRSSVRNIHERKLAE
jgi:PAS domain S-box-containing protein